MKKGVFTIMNYLMPEARRALDALLGQRRRRHGDVVAVLRPLGHRQDHALGRSATPADRRRRALLERRRRLQHRRRLLRQVHRPLAGEGARDLRTRSASAPCSRTWSSTNRSRGVDFADTSITENTRAAYPIEFIPNAKIPCVGGHPTEHHLPDLRRLRRAAAGEQADARRRRCTTSSAATRRRSPAPRSA